MSRYIDADSLRAEILEHKRETPERHERHNEIVYILGIVDRQPTAGVIGINDIKNIIDEELRDIKKMKPEDGENEITVDVLKTLYTAECRVVANRIAEFARDRDAVEKQKPEKAYRSNRQAIVTVTENICHSCGGVFYTVNAEGGYNFCYHCGQKLDWSGVI